MFDPHPDLTPQVMTGLGWIYLILSVMNMWWAYRCLKRQQHSPLFGWLSGMEIPSAAIWGSYSILLFLNSLAHFVGADRPERMVNLLQFLRWHEIKEFINLFANPIIYFILSVATFSLLILLRKWVVKPTVAWVVLNVSLVFLALSITDYDFRQIVGKPDNVPIVSMLFIIGFFTWLYFKQAVENDERIARGECPAEAVDNEKVLVWPDLVYSELICMVVLTAVLIAWGVLLQAPLEEPSSLVRTPNPSKAPWYFLGLQEMLVYYDPWLAGVVFPSLIVVGLMAIPYIDFNKKGNGYFTFNERKFAVVTFMFGFLPLWLAMIILGTFLRGPNWNFFGIYEFWDVHKLEVLTNVNLSEYVWVDFPVWLNSTLGIALITPGLPTASADASTPMQVGTILFREAPGFLLIFVYLFALPPILAVMWFREFFRRMGFIRYMVFSNLVLMMAALPLKMVLRWTFDLKYIVAIPEWFFNV